MHISEICYRQGHGIYQYNAHFCASSSEASNSSAEGSFKVLSIITSPEVYAASLSPVSIDRSLRILTGKEIWPLEETINICVFNLHVESRCLSG